MKKILGNYDNYDVLMGSSMDATGMYVYPTQPSFFCLLFYSVRSLMICRHVLIDFRDDGMTPFATVWKHGLVEEKV